MDPILVDVNVHPTKLEVRLSKEKQLYQLIVSKIQEAFKDRILIPKNNLDYVPKKNKVLHSFEQQKSNLNKDKTQRITKRRRFHLENSKPFMEENQNDEIVIKEDSYNPFVTKISESLIADDESSGYNNTREKDEDDQKTTRNFTRNGSNI